MKEWSEIMYDKKTGRWVTEKGRMIIEASEDVVEFTYHEKDVMMPIHPVILVCIAANRELVEQLLKEI